MSWLLPRRVVCTLLVLFSIAGVTARLPHLAAQPAAKPRTITVQETAGLERKGWPITVGILFRANELGDPATSLSLWRDAGTPQEARIALQVLDVVKPQYVEAKDREAKEKEEAQLVELCFLADVGANGTATYQLHAAKAGDPVVAAPLPAAPLTITGEGMGTAVDTGPARFAFDPISGQLLSYTPILAGSKQPLTFNQGAPRPVHWNPDVWAPPLTWGHASDWNVENPERRPDFKSARGPLAYRSVRSGIMPTSNGVQTSVTYMAFAGMPFLLESSSMEFTADTRVNAVRNNELVFNRGQHTHGVWIDEAGQVKTVLGYDPAEPKKFRGFLGSVEDPMIPFIGLFNNTQRYGIGIVNLARLDYAPLSIASTQDRSRYYFLDYGEHGTGEHYDWNFMYVSRSELPSASIVPKGALFAEHSAFLVFRTDTDPAKQFDEVKLWTKMLRQPPKVTVQ